jgi:hypothetical protein
VAILSLAFSIISVKDSLAIPTFSKIHKKNCSSCHTVWPMLNEKGRAFKEAGYQLEDEDCQKVVSDDLSLMKDIISGRANMRLYDKKGGEKYPDAVSRMRSFHELEVFLAARAGEDISTFVELETEDENKHFLIGDKEPIPFGIAAVAGVVGYHYNEALNIHLGFAEPTFADPYSAFSARKVTLEGRYVLKKGFITGTSQFISLSGRPATLPSLFYLVAISANNAKETHKYHGDAHNPEHTPFGNNTLRVAYDVKKGISIGAIYQREKAPVSMKKDAEKADATNIGIDATIQLKNIDANFAYITRDDKGDKNKVISVEVGYATKLGNINVAPYVRYDSYTANNGKDKGNLINISLNAFLTNNLKTQLTYETGKSASANAKSYTRMALVADLGF